MLLLTKVQWDYLNEFDAFQPIGDGPELENVAGFTLQDVDSQVEIDEDNVTVVTKDADGQKTMERAFTAHWAATPPGGEKLTGKIAKVVGASVGQEVHFELEGGKRETLVLDNPAVKLRRVFLWPESALDGACSDDGKVQRWDSTSRSRKPSRA